MNQNDREAFQKWNESKIQSIVGMTESEAKEKLSKEMLPEDLWRAACEYKQKQINNLEIEKQKLFLKMSKDLEIEKNKVIKLEEENQKLKDCVMFYAAGNVQFDHEYIAVQGGLVSKIGSYARKILAKLEEIKK